jgi:N-acetylmuramoyl-L-alanine amidase
MPLLTHIAARPASRGRSIAPAIALAVAITGWSSPTRADAPERTGPPAPTAVSAFAPVAPSPAVPDSFEWTPVTIDDREYVKASDVALFYRFSSCEVEETAASFRSPTMEMKWEVDGSLLTINETKFLLTTPCLKRAEDLLVARVDLVKWIDPLLRPAYLSKAEWFDTVVIDPGHGGLDNGTHGAFGDEKTYTLDLAGRLRSALQARGLKVVMTRETDVRVDKQIRGLLASEVPNSVLVSLHFNRDRRRSVRGLETYAMTPMGVKSSNDSRTTVEAGFGFQGNLRDKASLALAAAVHSQIIHRTGCEDRGVRRARFAVLKDSERAGILIEAGYLSHPEEGALINEPEYRTRLAIAIAEGVLHYRRAIAAAR